MALYGEPKQSVIAGQDPHQCQYFLVLETGSGQRIVMERLRDGRAACEADPEHVDDRCSLAKVGRRGSRMAYELRLLAARQVEVGRGKSANTTTSWNSGYGQLGKSRQVV